MRLETERLLVRSFREEDAEALFAILSDPAVMEFLEPPFTREQTLRFIREAGLREPPLVYAVLWKQSGRLIGHLIWHPWEDNAMELGWVLDQDYWGLGLAEELTAALLERTERDVVIECDPAQTATIRIAARFGFREIGEADGLLVFRRKAGTKTGGTI